MSTPRGEAHIYKWGKQGATFLSPTKTGAPTITLANGQTIKAVPGNAAGGVFYNEGRYKWVFKGLTPGQEATLNVDGNSQKINTSNGYRGDDITNLGKVGKGSYGDSGGGGGGGGAVQPGTSPGTNDIFGGGTDNAGNPVPNFVDPSNLKAGQVDVPPIKIPPYKLIDPKTYAESYAPFVREQSAENLEIAKSQALDLAGLESDINKIFANKSLDLQTSLLTRENAFNRGEISTANKFNVGEVTNANAFNRAELNTAIDSSGIPIRQTVNEQLTTGRQLAKGLLPTTLEDRAFEMAARSKAGDALSQSGLGTSAFTQSAIDKYSVNERLNLMDRGNTMVDQWISKGASLLLDSPIKYNPLLNQPNSARVSQDIKGLPGVNPQEAAIRQQQSLNQATLIPSLNALNSSVEQEKFKTTTDYNVAVANQATDLSQQTTNVGNNLKVDLTKLQQTINNANLSNEFATRASERAREQRTANENFRIQAISEAGSNVTQSLY